MIRILRNKGVTIIELIISIGIIAIVSTGTVVFLNNSLSVYRFQQTRGHVMQQARSAIDWLVRDIESSMTLVEADQNNMTLISSDGEYVSYFSENQTLQRKECMEPQYLVAEDINQLSFEYYDVENEIINDPIANIQDLKAIEIDITTQQAGGSTLSLNTVAGFGIGPTERWGRLYELLPDEQEWVIRARETSDEGYIMSVEFPPDWQASMGKMDNEGAIEWFMEYNDGSTSTYLDYVVDAIDGSGYLGLGKRGGKLMLIKTDLTGQVEWANFYDSPLTVDYWIMYTWRLLDQTENGYILGCYTRSFGVGSPTKNNLWLIKTDAAGGIIWQKTYGTVGQEYISSVQPTSDGGFIVGGYTNDFFDSRAYGLVIKLNSSGNIMWAKRYGAPGINDTVENISQAIDDGYIMYARLNSLGQPHNYIVKLDSQGDVEWVKQLVGTYDPVISLKVTRTKALDGYLMAATYQDGSFLIKLDPNGDIVFQKRYFTGHNRRRIEVNDFEETDAGQIALAGYLYTSTAGGMTEEYSRAMLFKVDSLGSAGCCFFDDNTINLSMTDRVGLVAVDVTADIIEEVSSGVLTPIIGLSATPLPFSETFLCPDPDYPFPEGPP